MSSDTIAALAQKLLDNISIMKGPIFVGLSVLGLLYYWHINPFGIFTFLEHRSSSRKCYCKLWCFVLNEHQF
jgi:hypothetical protein